MEKTHAPSIFFFCFCPINSNRKIECNTTCQVRKRERKRENGMTRKNVNLLILPNVFDAGNDTRQRSLLIFFHDSSWLYIRNHGQAHTGHCTAFTQIYKFEPKCCLVGLYLMGSQIHRYTIKQDTIQISTVRHILILNSNTSLPTENSRTESSDFEI